MESLGEQQRNNDEHALSQEFLKSEYRVMQKYFDLAGTAKHERIEWVNTYGEALRKLILKEPEFSSAFMEGKNASKEQFEEKLKQNL